MWMKTTDDPKLVAQALRGVYDYYTKLNGTNKSTPIDAALGKVISRAMHDATNAAADLKEQLPAMSPQHRRHALSVLAQFDAAVDGRRMITETSIDDLLRVGTQFGRAGRSLFAGQHDDDPNVPSLYDNPESNNGDNNGFLDKANPYYTATNALLFVTGLITIFGIYKIIKWMSKSE